MAKITTGTTNGDIKITPNGTGKTVVGTGAASATVQSSGDYDLVLQTGNATTGSITITDGANGNIALTPNGTGEVDISKADIDGGTIDGTTIGGTTPAAGTFTTFTSTGIDDNASSGPALTIDPSGNVGIGAAASGSKFYTYDSSTADDYVAGRFHSEAGGGAGVETQTLVKIEKGNGYGGAIGGYIKQGSDHGITFNTLGSGTLSERMRIDSSGNVTLPSQPCFSAYNSSNDINVTGDGTAFTVEFNQEVWDLGTNFGSNTFTAPVAGKYFLATKINIYGLDPANHSAITITLKTSNRDWGLNITDSAAFSSGITLGIHGSALVDMDASDTAYIQLTVSGTSKTASVSGTTSPDRTWFSGYLVA